MIFRHSLFCSFSLMTLSVLTAATPHSMAQSTSAPDRWSTQKANDWYQQQPWLVGADFIPSNAINELEMFQAATFDPAINDKELGMAESIGMNTVRVFLQDQLWQQDPQGFKQRLDTFLRIAATHHIKRCSCYSIPVGRPTPSSVLNTRLSLESITPVGCRVPGKFVCMIRL